MNGRQTSLIVGLVILSFALALSANGKEPGPNGRIAYGVFDVHMGSSRLYTANPDGSHAALLADRELEFAHWSPDGTEIVALGSAPDGTENRSAVIVNVDTGDTRDLVMSDPTLFYACPIWSPGGTRLTCEGLDETNPSRNGIYTIRSSDGGGLTQITSNPSGDDMPGDYSPDGKRIVFMRWDSSGAAVGLLVQPVGGGTPVRITPAGLIPDPEGMTWSPDGRTIVFSARHEDERFAVYTVAPNGSRLRHLPVPCGGLLTSATSVSCRQPDWSPDGSLIMFSRGTVSGRFSDLYTVRPDGSHFTRITVTPSTFDNEVDWGTHPLAG
jgi:Tol biopolymer transport system component